MNATPEGTDGGTNVGKNKDQTKQTTGSMPRESSQVGTHGQTGSGPGLSGSGQLEAGRPDDVVAGRLERFLAARLAGGRPDRSAQPSGTSPLDKDQQPVNQNRPVQQNR